MPTTGQGRSVAQGEFRPQDSFAPGAKAGSFSRPRDDPRVALEHVGLDPGATQALRESQTSQTGSRDRNSHHTPPATVKN